MTHDVLVDAMGGLRAWRAAGESAAKRGDYRALLPLDGYVDIILDALAWEIEPEHAAEEEIERPSHVDVESALGKIAEHFDDGPLGADFRLVHEFLSKPETFAGASMIRSPMADSSDSGCGQPAISEAAGDNEGWIEWTGGECPVPSGTLVEVKWADPKRPVRRAVAEIWSSYPFEWSRSSVDDHPYIQIIAYRVVSA